MQCRGRGEGMEESTEGMERHNARPVYVRSQGFRVQHIPDANLAVCAAHRRAGFNISGKRAKSGCRPLQSISATSFLPPCPCRDPALQRLSWRLQRRWCRARERGHAVPPLSQPFPLPPWLITRNNYEKGRTLENNQ
jgi:hypothetical protein